MIQIIRYANEGFKTSITDITKGKNPFYINGCYAFINQVDIFALTGNSIKRQQEDIHIVYLPESIKVYAWNYCLKEKYFIDFGICKEKMFTLGEVEERIFCKRRNSSNQNIGYEHTEIFIPGDIVENIKPFKKIDDLIDINGNIEIRKVIINQYNSR